MESSAKKGNFLLEGHRSTFLGQKHKSAISDRTPPTFTLNLVYMCSGGFRGHKSSDLNYLDSFKSYCNSSDLGFLGSGGGVEQVGGGVQGDQL